MVWELSHCVPFFTTTSNTIAFTGALIPSLGRLPCVVKYQKKMFGNTELISLLVVVVVCVLLIFSGSSYHLSIDEEITDDTSGQLSSGEKNVEAQKIKKLTKKLHEERVELDFYLVSASKKKKMNHDLTYFFCFFYKYLGSCR